MNLLVLFNADVSVGPRIYLGTYLVSIVYNYIALVLFYPPRTTTSKNPLLSNLSERMFIKVQSELETSNAFIFHDL